MLQSNHSKNPKAIDYTPRGAEKIYYLSHKLWLNRHFRLANILKRFNTFFFRNYIPPSVRIGKRLQLPHGGFGIIINGNAVIGDDAIIFQNVTIGNGGAHIGDRVYIGSGAVILGRINIGDDVSIGANTFVNFSIPDGSTVVGNKGTIITMKEDSK